MLTFNIPLYKNKFFFIKNEENQVSKLGQEIYMNFDFKNRCKNEFKDHNEKSCSWSRSRISHKIDFKAQWLRDGHADSVEVNEVLVVGRENHILTDNEKFNVRIK